MSVKCAKKGEGSGASGPAAKGEMHTFIDAKPAALVRQEAITAGERFALDCDGLFVFSSRNPSMMPGGCLLRTVRVEAGFCSEAEVKEARARDKVISVFEQDRAAEVDAQRKGLSLKVSRERAWVSQHQDRLPSTTTCS